MPDYIGQVLRLEQEMADIKAQLNAGVDKFELYSRVAQLEGELSALKAEFCYEEPVVDGAFRVRNTEAEVPVVEWAFRVRNVGGAVSACEPPVCHREDMEAHVGKTVMGLLATVLILVSLALFGSIVYPMLGLFGKVAILYSVSFSFIGLGLWGIGRKNKAFFTALAGCGLAAFYLSSIISYMVYQLFGVGVLGVLVGCWVVGVGIVAKKKVPVFRYIGYVGVVCSTVLCVFQFQDSPIAFVCYIVGVVVLYLFTRRGEYVKDAFYFIQAPICLCLLATCYTVNLVVILLIMLVCVMIYIAQFYLYEQVTSVACLCMILSEAVLGFGYMCCIDSLSVDEFLNVFFIFLSGLLAIWSLVNFEDGLLRFAPCQIFCFVIPILKYGDFYTDYISYLPFAIAILVGGHALKNDVIKSIGGLYAILYMVSKPNLLGEFGFYTLIFISLLAFWGMFWFCGFTDWWNRVIVACVSCVGLSVVAHGSDWLLIVAYFIAVVLGCFFNSDYFATYELSQRLGWSWTGFWMAFGSCSIFDCDNTLMLVMLFLLTLCLFMTNVKWQLECEHWGAGLEFCVKSVWYLLMLLLKLEATGVVISIGFLVLSVGYVALGFFIRRKIIRLHGLVLAVISVLKCLLLDISYGSVLARPVGLLVAGLLCFGISWVYSVLEKRLKE